jgi:anaphase-promoting complex subunit 2
MTLSPVAQDVELWDTFESLGLLDRYENIIANVGYECIESHVVKVCEGKWSDPMMPELHAWMRDNVLPWMLLMYARGATSKFMLDVEDIRTDIVL